MSDEKSNEIDAIQSKLNNTFFFPLFSAGAGILFPEEKQLGVFPENEATRCLKTQKNNIKLFMRLLGLLKTSHRSQRERAAFTLNIDLSLLENSRRTMNPRIRAGPLLKTRGQCGSKILKTIVAQGNVFALIKLGAQRIWGTNQIRVA